MSNVCNRLLEAPVFPGGGNAAASLAQGSPSGSICTEDRVSREMNRLRAARRCQRLGQRDCVWFALCFFEGISLCYRCVR